MNDLREALLEQGFIAPHKIQKRMKYGNKRTTVDDITFDSQREAKEYLVYRDEQRKGLIRNLRVHPRYAITINSIHICYVELDFYFEDVRKNWAIRDVDVKGHDTQFSKLKRKMFEAYYPGRKVELVR